MAPWVSITPPNQEHTQYGWKLHLTATLENANEAVESALDIAFKHGIPLKHVVGVNDYLWLQSKQNSRLQSGKIIVFYPPNEEAARGVAKELEAVEYMQEGPHVITDRRVPGMKNLYYRWGAYVRSGRINDYGDFIDLVPDGDGGEGIDTRSPAPTWTAPMDDPFTSQKSQNPEAVRIPAIGPYRVESAITFTNAGGTYIAHHSTTGEKWVLKESRPSTGYVGEDDAITRLRREHLWSRRVKTLLGDAAPRVGGLITVDRHEFLPLSYVDGVNWYTWVAQNNPLYKPGGTDPSAFSAYMKNVETILSTLREKVERLHKNEIAIGDVSDSNLLITESLQGVLIDFELAGPADDIEPSIGTFEYSLPKPSVPISRKQRDIYAIDCLAITAVLRVQLKDGLNGLALDRLLRLLRRQGLSLPAWWLSIADRVKKANRTLVQAHAAKLDESDLHNADQRIRKVATGLSEGIVKSIPSPYSSDFAASNQTLNGNRLGFMRGEAGILYALAVTGHPIPADFVEGFAKAAEQAIKSRSLPVGIANGIAGIVLAAKTLNLVELERVAGEQLSNQNLWTDNPTLLYGTAGAAVVAAKVGLVETSIALIERSVECSTNFNWTKNGLFEGISGVAHASNEVGKAKGRLQEKSREMHKTTIGALLAEIRDSAAAVSSENYSYFSDRTKRITYPYLSSGSAGLVYILSAMEKAGPEESQEFGLWLRRLAADASHPVTIACGLSDGVSGLYAVSKSALRGEDPTDKRRRDDDLADALEMHLVPDGDGGLFVLDSRSARVDLSLENGSAGVLLAIANSVDCFDWLCC